MFGPNTYFKDNVNISYNHRDNIFYDLLAEVKIKFSELFGLQDYDILFIPGSGTIGIESMIYSYRYNIKVVGVEGTFTKRWRDMISNYVKNKDTSKTSRLFCLLETSKSEFYEEDNCLGDAISGFPYKDIPKNTKCFVTCLNKQLRSYVGVAVVGVRKDCWHEFIEDKMSYLNLYRYKKAIEKNQTPSTFPTFILEHFNKVLDNFDVNTYRDYIDEVSNIIVKSLPNDSIIGNKYGPVITIPKSSIPEDIAEKYQLYGYHCPDRLNYQIFTYSDSLQNYIDLSNDLRVVRSSI